jgi:hypothetical protein
VTSSLSPVAATVAAGVVPVWHIRMFLQTARRHSDISDTPPR